MHAGGVRAGVNNGERYCWSRFTVPLTRGLSAEATVDGGQDPPEKSGGATLSDDDVDRLTGGDEVLKKKLKFIQFEYEIRKQEGARLPQYIKEDHWKELLTLDSRKARQKYLAFLHGKELYKLKAKMKKEESKMEWERRKQELPEEGENQHIQYNLSGNSISLRIYDSKIDHFNNSKCINAKLFGSPLVYDLGYTKHLNKIEQQLTANQLQLTFARNREHSQPFDLHFCNADPNSELMKRLETNIPSIHLPEFPIVTTSQSYLDIFPRNRLVYLTPHCQNNLTNFDHDSIYIVGGIVDRYNQEPLSLAKAKRENLRMARLPLDKYLDWGVGGKSLPLNQMIDIMLELKTSGDWNKAFEWIPRRKLKTEEETQQLLQRSAIVS